MSDEYLQLRTLKESSGYKLLQDLWIHQVAKVEEARDRAAGRGQESAWRYQAGIEKGFKLAMTALDRAMLDMQKKEETVEEEDSVRRLMEELKIKEPTQ